ncbi:MAG TPA: TetR/AcrR family transcriptional regulator [Propionicimonas sp.]
MTQRADARRNREALVAAAEEVFAEGGASAPLDTVARRAGVGRGTLYRHFPDRAALAVAVYERRLAELEDVAHEHRDDPALLERLVFGVAERQTHVPGLVAVLLDTEAGRVELARLDDRTRSIVAGPLARARDRGEVRPDVTDDDLMLLFAMVDGLVHALPAPLADERVRRACRLMLDGLRQDGVPRRTATEVTDVTGPKS